MLYPSWPDRKQNQLQTINQEALTKGLLTVDRVKGTGKGILIDNEAQKLKQLEAINCPLAEEAKRGQGFVGAQ